jgi:hypothetical protein
VDELDRLERLHHVVVRARLVPGLHVVGERLGRAADDRDAGRRRVGPQTADQLQPVHLRHHHVDDHGGGVDLARQLQGLCAAGGRHHHVPLELEAELQERRHGRVVIDDEDHDDSLIDRVGTRV